MKLYTLREDIDHIYGDVEVYVLVGDYRYPLTKINDGFLDQGFVEFNVDTTTVRKRYEPTHEEDAFMKSYLKCVASAGRDELLYFFEYKDTPKHDGLWWWTSVMDAWLVWKDASKYTQEILYK
jgi:hypothetical protein